MKKIHRTLSLFTVAAMCTALLCSCGEVPDSSQTDSSSKAATTTTADTTADTTTTGEASSTASATSAPDSSVSDSSSAVTDDTKTNGITPAMWKVTSPEGNTMVMLGSFHALKDECYPLPEAVTNAYNLRSYFSQAVLFVIFSRTSLSAQRSCRLSRSQGQWQLPLRGKALLW